MSTRTATNEDAGEVSEDLTERRPEVVRRLLDRGVPLQTLRALFPDWDRVLGEAGDLPRDVAAAAQPAG